MIPQILNLGPIPINSFGLLVALAFFAGIYTLSRSFEKNGIPGSLAEKYVITAAVAGLLGARIWYILVYAGEMQQSIFELLFSSSGFVFYGGFIIGLSTLLLLTRFDKISFIAFLDSIGPTLALGYAIGRVGCQLSGDGDYGIVVDSILGMSYSQGVVPTAPGVEVYPTPIYESVLSLIICYILLTVENTGKLRKAFSRFGLYLILMSAERFFIEFIRIEDRYFYALSEAQFIAIGLAILGLLLTSRSLMTKT